MISYLTQAKIAGIAHIDKLSHPSKDCRSCTHELSVLTQAEHYLWMPLLLLSLVDIQKEKLLLVRKKNRKNVEFFFEISDAYLI